MVSEIYTLHYYDIQPQAVLVTTTLEQFANQPGIITNPHPFVLSTAAASTYSYDTGRTPIYICAFESKQPLLVSVFSFLHKYLECNRLWPSHRSLMAHRKKDHNTEDGSQIITWNEELP